MADSQCIGPSRRLLIRLNPYHSQRSSNRHLPLSNLGYWLFALPELVCNLHPL
jgi:hypothetical protein